MLDVRPAFLTDKRGVRPCGWTDRSRGLCGTGGKRVPVGTCAKPLASRSNIRKNRFAKVCRSFVWGCNKGLACRSSECALRCCSFAHMGENQVINQAGANEHDYRIFDSHLQVRNACDMLLHMMQDRSNSYRMDYCKGCDNNGV